jgi:hypothetical protein
MNTQTTYLASKPHYEILDGLRGVAAVMVIVFHLFEAHAGGSHLTQIINHGYLAVDFFFMLSGFVIGYAYDDRWNRMTVGTFFKRRIIRPSFSVVPSSMSKLSSFPDASAETMTSVASNVPVASYFGVPPVQAARRNKKGNNFNDFILFQVINYGL